MEVLDELRLEAERRASTPEGLLALADLLLADFQKVLDEKPTQRGFLTIQNLADFFGEIQSKNRSVTFMDFNPADFEDLFGDNGRLRAQVEVYPIKDMQDNDYETPDVFLWGAQMKIHPPLGIGEIIVTDSLGCRHKRQYWAEPRLRMAQLLRNYVLCKRQFEYFRKLNRITKDGKEGGYDIRHLHYDLKKQVDSYGMAIDAYQRQIEELENIVGPATAAQWKKDIGPTLHYGHDTIHSGIHKVFPKDERYYLAVSI